MDDILFAAEEILGPAVRVERHRDWAVFWCPFHNDSSRAGQGGHPNFGVHLVDGYWKCLRCGATVEMRRQGDAGRSTYFCRTCQSVQ